MGKLEKIPAWQLTKVRNTKEVTEEARVEGRKVHFASLMDLCHLKNLELEPQYQKYKGRVVLRGDIVKDDSGSYAVFTEQGSSASQMTAAKVRTSFQDYWDAQDKQQMQYPLKPGQNGRCTDVVQNSKVRMPTFWQDYHGNGITDGKKFQIGNVYSLTEKKDCSYLCMWMISNWLGKSRTLVRHGKFS